MDNNNLNNLKEQIRDIYDNILALQLPEKEDNPLYIQKLDTLLSNVQELINQNKQIINQNEKTYSLLENLIEKQKEVVVLNAKKEDEQPINIKEEEPLDIFVLQEENLENIKQEEVEKKEEPQQEEVKPKQEEVKQEPESQPKQEKETSSVLEFLHKRVIKDNPSKNISESKSKERKSESVTATLNSLFADSEEENIETKEEKPVTLFDNKEEKDKADVLVDKQESIGDKFASQTKNDLRVAIGINYKFMFINDLFSGDIKEYENFINQLNEKTSFSASMEVINQKRSVFKWATTSPAYANLVDIIQKRFE